MNAHLTRRQFLGTAATAALAARLPAQEPPGSTEPAAFFLVSDTHFLADSKDPAKLDPRSAAVTTRLVEQLNRLPGTEIPAAAGGGTVRVPRGVIHAGDCIDSGDKNLPAMQATEWSAFTAAFGLTGHDGQLKFPVYEVHGNHDNPRGEGLAIRQIRARNRSRPGLRHISPNGLHYSWDWGPVHCVNLGIVVGSVPEPKRARRYDPMASLDFLIQDLREQVGTSGRPVIITHHVDMPRYSQPVPIADAIAAKMEWDPEDARGYYQALAGYRVIGILYGHTHARNITHWDGTPRKAERGIPAFNVAKASHFSGPQQALFYCEARAEGLTVREFVTADAWKTGTWTPQVWTGGGAVSAPPAARPAVKP